MQPALNRTVESVMPLISYSHRFVHRSRFRTVQNVRFIQHASPLRPLASTPKQFTSAKLLSLRVSTPSKPFHRILRYTPRSNQLRLSSSSLNSPKPNPTPTLGSPEPAPSLSQRLKKLSREYGWTALGVYLALSALDFPFCFLAVRLLGTERIGKWEHEIMTGFWKLVGYVGLDFRGEKQTVEGAAESVEATVREGYIDHGLREADAANRGANASIWTQLALAYAVHKSFIFVRVPLTAAVLPKVVKTLRSWGYNVGKRTPKVT